MVSATRTFYFVLSAAASILLSGCGSDPVGSAKEETGGVTGPIATEGLTQSSHPRNLSPAVSTSDVKKLVACANTFGLKLFTTVNSTEDSNIFISPYSISSALTMVYAGAENRTAREMAAALSLTVPDALVFASYNYLDVNLQNAAADSGCFKLSIANALWGQTGFSFENDFLDLLAENYGAGLRLLDFSTKPEASRITINNWVEDATENRIKELLPKGSISPDTRLVLTNAVYFIAEWVSQFLDNATFDAQFYRNVADSIAIPTMHQTNQFTFGEFSDYKAIVLPYKGGRTSMTILLPEQDINKFVSMLTIGKITEMETRLTLAKVELSMPKFEFTYSINLNQALEHLGMKDAFTGNADFSGITRQEKLVISDVIHKAFIKVDEKKTEAAAATAVITMRIISMPPDLKRMTVNRPFVFIIKDEITGTYLFMGKVIDPSAK